METKKIYKHRTFDDIIIPVYETSTHIAYLGNYETETIVVIEKRKCIPISYEDCIKELSEKMGNYENKIQEINLQIKNIDVSECLKMDIYNTLKNIYNQATSVSNLIHQSDDPFEDSNIAEILKEIDKIYRFKKTYKDLCRKNQSYSQFTKIYNLEKTKNTYERHKENIASIANRVNKYVIKE